VSETVVRVRIEGRVQGVWFRGWTLEEARHRKLAGWVRNRLDGSVEALFSGPEAVVEEMVALCHHGPRWARVAAVRRLPTEADEFPGEDFAYRPTA